VRFVLDGTVYDTSAVDHISLADALAYDREARYQGWPSWAEMLDLMSEAMALGRGAKSHPGTLVWIALAVWRARKDAGEDTLTFNAAIESVPMLDPSRFYWLPEPPAPSVEPEDPQQPRPDSGRG